MEGEVVEHQPIRVLEYRLPFRNYCVVLFVFYAISFSITWYRVWWDTLFGIFITTFALLALYCPFLREDLLLKIFYYGTFASLCLHIITIGILSYELVLTDLEAALGVSQTFKSLQDVWGVYVGLILVICGQTILAVVTVSACFRLRMEMERNNISPAAIYPGYTSLSAI